MNARKLTLDRLLATADRLQRARMRMAERDLARLVKLRASMATEFYAMGVVLGRLRGAGIARALGHRDLYDLAASRAALGRRDVADLVAIATSLEEREARDLGWRLAAAFVALGRAAGSPPYVVYRRGLSANKGAVLARGERRVRVVLEAAKALRHRDGAPRGGRTTTPAERAAAAELAVLLRQGGCPVSVQAVATRPGQPATFRIIDLDATALARITAALPPR